MNKLKEENMRRALSHIERHKQAINTSNNSEENDFHKLGSIIFVVGKSPMDIMEPILL